MRRRWLSALFVAGLVAFAVGAFLAVIHEDVTELLVGMFGIAQWRAATCLLLGSAAVMAAVAWRGRHSLQRVAAAARVILAAAVAGAALNAWAGKPPYREETVSYPSGETRLAATLYLPRMPAPHPAIVIVHGSAPFKRTFYHLWADRLARHGFAVLLADKRGVGASGGEFEKNDNASAANLGLLASDVSAGAHYLLTRRDIRGGSIGLLGLSQAGWVAPQAALATPEIRYLALVTGPAASTGEEGVWSRLRGDDDGPAEAGRAEAEAVLDTVRPRGVDAREALARLSVPSLWLFGSDDNSIPTKKSVGALDSLAAAGRPVEWRTFDGYGHILIGRPGGGLPRVAPESWPVLLAWLARQSAY